jgi:hypothetical protein
MHTAGRMCARATFVSGISPRRMGETGDRILAGAACVTHMTDVVSPYDSVQKASESLICCAQPPIVPAAPHHSSHSLYIDDVLINTG